MAKNASKEYIVVLVGATGTVGKEFLKILVERNFPVKELRPVASAKSMGKSIEFGTQSILVKELTPKVFEGADIAFFTASTSISREFVPMATKAGCLVVDDSSAFRMDDDIPLVIPEINGELLTQKNKRRIYPVANCAVIQLVMALAPIHKKVGIKRIVVSTYQSTSGAGKRAMEELSRQVKDLFNLRESEPKVFPHRIAFNVLPQIDRFLTDGNTAEEEKIVLETKKILGDPAIGVSATAVRVPTFHGHAESVNVETKKKITADEARNLISKAKGLELVDEPKELRYPLISDATGQDEVFVGRIREDASKENCLNLWIAADNIRKGAALNAIQILEELHSKNLI